MTEAIPYHSNESREAIQNPPSEGKRLAIDMRVPSDEAVEKAGASAPPELLALNERQRQEKQELYNRYASERESILSTTHEEKQELVTDKARRSLYDTL